MGRFECLAYTHINWYVFQGHQKAFFDPTTPEETLIYILNNYGSALHRLPDQSTEYLQQLFTRALVESTSLCLLIIAAARFFHFSLQVLLDKAYAKQPLIFFQKLAEYQLEHPDLPNEYLTDYHLWARATRQNPDQRVYPYLNYVFALKSGRQNRREWADCLTDMPQVLTEPNLRFRHMAWDISRYIIIPYLQYGYADLPLDGPEEPSVVPANYIWVGPVSPLGFHWIAAPNITYANFLYDLDIFTGTTTRHQVHLLNKYACRYSDTPQYWSCFFYRAAETSTPLLLLFLEAARFFRLPLYNSYLPLIYRYHPRQVVQVLVEHYQENPGFPRSLPDRRWLEQNPDGTVGAYVDTLPPSFWLSP